jgi:hypothetical protein
MSLILGGRAITSIPDADKVISVRDPENGQLVLRPGVHKNLRRRTHAPRAITIHWVGSENFPVRSADPTGKAKWSVLDTLLERKLGYDFVIDSALHPGRRGIYQLADPINTRTPHAGIANDQSLAIAFISRGFAAKDDVRGSDLLDRTELDWNEPRDVFTARVGSAPTTHLVSLHPDALHDLVWLAETLCGLLSIPRVIPWQSTAPEYVEELRATEQIRAVPVEHNGSLWLPLYDRDTAPWGRARNFEGVLGHFHVHPDKWDPGPQPFEALWAEGFNPAGVKLPRA